MNKDWYGFAIYLDGVRRFEALQADRMALPEVVERIRFVHDNIEYCFAEGRSIDRDIFDDLEDVEACFPRRDCPPNAEVQGLAERLAARYGFDEDALTAPKWRRTLPHGEIVIWIDQAKIIADSNRRLFDSAD